MPENDAPDGKLKDYLEEIEATLKDPIHKRILRSYRVSNPVAAMEAELKKIVQEAMRDEIAESES